MLGWGGPLVTATGAAPRPFFFDPAGLRHLRHAHQGVVLLCQAGTDHGRRLRRARPPQMRNTVNRLVRLQLQGPQLCKQLPVAGLDI